MANPPDVQRALEVGMAALAQDQRTIAERKWQAPVKAPKPQKPCDIGLFSDESRQSSLF
jgi:hypothetical protein